MTYYISIISILLIAGFVQGLTGFGSALVAIPLLSLIMGVKSAVPLVVLTGIVIGLQLIYNLRQHIEFKTVWPLLIGSLAGIPIGVFVLKQVPENIISLSLAIFVIAYAVLSLLNMTMSLKQSNSYLGYIAGFCSGGLGAAMGFSGPPIVMYTNAQPCHPLSRKATLTTYLLISSVVTTTAFTVSGLFTQSILFDFAVGLIPLMTGTALGIILFKKFNVHRQEKVVLIFIVLLGVGLIINSL